MTQSGTGSGARVHRPRRAKGWDPNRAAVFIVSTLVAGVAVNLISDALPASPMTWIAPTVLALVALAVSPGGLLRWQSHGSRQWAFWAALAALACYVVVAVYLGSSSLSFAPSVVQTFCLWLAVSLLSWQTLRDHAGFGEVALSVAMLLPSAMSFLFGVGILLGPPGFGGVLPLDETMRSAIASSGRGPVYGAAFVLMGVSGSALALGALLDLAVARALAILGLAAAGVPLTVAIAVSGGRLLALGTAVFSLGTVLVALGELLDGRITFRWWRLLLRVAGLVYSASLLLVAVEFFRNGRSLLGLAFIFGSAGCLVLAVSIRRTRSAGVSVGAIIFGLVLFLCAASVQLLGQQWLALGVYLVALGFGIVGVGGLWRDARASRSRAIASQFKLYLLRDRHR